MNLILKIYLMAVLAFCCACGHAKKAQSVEVKEPVADSSLADEAQTIFPNSSDKLIENILKAYPQYFDTILPRKKDLKLQIIYTAIDRNKNNKPSFTAHYFNVNADNYFYPASTVKMPVALLALQKIHELNIKGVDKNTSFITETGFKGETPVYNDPNSPDGRPTIANYIRKIFLVSDNDAYNRLYEFLGQEYINDHLHAMGYNSAAIVHRLEVSMNEEQHRNTNPIMFLDTANNILYSQPLQRSNFAYPDRHDSVANAYYKNGELINQPMNFSRKNKVSLQDLTNILKSVLFPEEVAPNQRFNLTEDDYSLVKKYMSQFPGETIFPQYDTTEFYDAYVKLLKYGSGKGSLPKQIRIFNKEGDAYGFLTDIAYIADFENKIEFMLSATIYCNSDGVMNDDHYDYDSVGYPYLKHLGEVFYNYELQRKRKHTPDLSTFKITYDK
ncbi:serine hydrolase [Pinibacter soli]|uniref:beta-lactamase n=1 Tax=Pinibacter soli TaxID=3044211 RepID=A0ABT6RA47_9BACT|nr:serine hydrolase [Pinibacter soli]MDI3319336.1 serine hydrolase [Pinibacter soli]